MDRSARLCQQPTTAINDDTTYKTSSRRRYDRPYCVLLWYVGGGSPVCKIRGEREGNPRRAPVQTYRKYSSRSTNESEKENYKKRKKMFIIYPHAAARDTRWQPSLHTIGEEAAILSRGFARSRERNARLSKFIFETITAAVTADAPPMIYDDGRNVHLLFPLHLYASRFGLPHKSRYSR